MPLVSDPLWCHRCGINSTNAMISKYAPIRKTGPFVLSPNLMSYEATQSTFNWDSAERLLEGLPGGKLNIAHEAVDRHARGPGGRRTAIRWLGRKGDVRDLSYAMLAAETSRFASALRQLGVGKGDRVFTLSSRIPELYVATLGTLKNGSVAAPLFSAFGPEPIYTRLSIGKGKVLVTTDALYRKKVLPIRDRLPDLERVIVIGNGPQDTVSYADLMASGDPATPVEPMDPEDMALLHFTSGTTGTPKGAIHVHQAALHHYVSALYALDLHPDDTFWCTADPGWVTGTSYGIIAPLLHGVTNVVDERDFDADRWYGIIERERVSVWYTAPTAIRMLMKVGASVAKEYDLSSLRFVASVGEPLTGRSPYSTPGS